MCYSQVQGALGALTIVADVPISPPSSGPRHLDPPHCPNHLPVPDCPLLSSLQAWKFLQTGTSMQSLIITLIVSLEPSLTAVSFIILTVIRFWDRIQQWLSLPDQVDNFADYCDVLLSISLSPNERVCTCAVVATKKSDGDAL